MQALVDLVLAHLQDMVMQQGIARAPYMNEHLEPLADDRSTNDDEKIGIDTPDINGKEANDHHTMICCPPRAAAHALLGGAQADRPARTAAAADGG